MIRFIDNNKGSILFSALVVMLGVAIGLMVYGTFHSAEAVLEEPGNVTTTDNPHNFSVGSSGIQAQNETRICIFCHTAHNAIQEPEIINAPLWNHELSGQTYKVLSPGSVINSAIKFPTTSGVGNINFLSSPAAPDGASRLCLGCHDGTIGIGNVASEVTPIAMNIASSACLDGDGSIASSCASYIGNDLTTKHVISIPMNDALISASIANCGVNSQTTRLQYPWDGGQGTTVLLRPTLQKYKGSGGIPGGSAGMPANKYNTGYLYGVQCSTCHDPHKWASSGEGYKFIVTNTFDALCQACHTTAGCP